MKLMVLEAHRSDFPAPIRFKKGDRLTTAEKTTAFEGWVLVTTPGGNQGWAPIPFVQIEEGNRAVANENYTDRELDTHVGEELTLHHEMNDWGWVENRDGTCGCVPMKTVTTASG